MKKLGFIVAAVAALCGLRAQAALPAAVSSENLNQVFRAVETAFAVKTNAINWQVGDYQKMVVDLGGFLKGSGQKEVTKDEPSRNAVWYKTTIDLVIQKQVVESLIDRATGKELKRIVNGQEQDPNAGDGKVEIIEQSETDITVPAGHFDCVYIKAKVTQQGQTTDVELWANPVDVNLDGMLKMSIAGQLPVTMTLQEFGPRH